MCSLVVIQTTPASKTFAAIAANTWLLHNWNEYDVLYERISAFTN